MKKPTILWTLKNMQDILDKQNMTLERVRCVSNYHKPTTRYFVFKKGTKRLCRYTKKLSVIRKWIIKNKYEVNA